MKNLRIPLALLATIMLASCGVPQRMIRFSPMLADSLRAARVDLADYERKYARYDGVFLLAEESLEHVVEPRQKYWRCYRMRTLRYIVLDPDAEWLSTFNLGVDDGNALISATIHVLNPDGSVRTYGTDDLKKTVSSDGETRYKLAYADIRKGSIVQESYEEALMPYSSEALRPVINLQYAVPVERVIAQWAIPSPWTTDFKDVAPAQRPGMNSTDYPGDMKKIFRYEATDVPAVNEEPYAPYFKEVAQYIECQAVGDRSMSTRWSSISDNFSEIRDDDSRRSSDVRDVVDSIVRGKHTDIEKLNAITRFVQRNIAFERKYEEKDVSATLESGRGNILQICALTRGMLEDADIPARIVLAHSARDGYFDSTFISIGQLNVPLVEAIINDTPYVLFPYWKNYPVNVVPGHLQGQRGLIIAGEKDISTLVTLPVGDTVANTLDDAYELTIGDDGDVAVEEVRSLHGTNAFWERERLAAMDEEETAKEIRELLTYSDGDIKVKDFEILNKDDYEQPLVIKTRYSIDNLVTVTPEEVIFQTGGLFSPSTARKRKLDTTERQNPIRIYENEELVKRITVNYPASWKLTTELENTTQTNEFGSISGTYGSGEGRLTVEHRRVLHRASAPKEKASELLAVTGRKSRLNVPTLIFKVSR